MIVGVCKILIVAKSNIKDPNVYKSPVTRCPLWLCVKSVTNLGAWFESSHYPTRRPADQAQWKNVAVFAVVVVLLVILLLWNNWSLRPIDKGRGPTIFYKKSHFNCSAHVTLQPPANIMVNSTSKW